MEVKEFLIDEDKAIIGAMELLDKVAKKVLFVVSKQGKLIAAITDGDIRRWILKKGSLDAKVRDIANYNPKFLFERDRNRAKDYMKEYSIEALPIVNDDMEVNSIVLWNDQEFHRRRNINIPVVIMAGGLGTRLYPYTKVLPKPLIPIGEIPIIEHIINRFHYYGCKDFHLILNHKKNMIKAYFSELNKDYNIRYIDEDEPLGTGGGLSLLKGIVNQTFILSNCDILIEEDFSKIYNFHKKQDHLITMICSLKRIQIPYGVIEIGENGNIENMEEKPEISFFTNTGVYIVEPKVINELKNNHVVSFPDIIQKYKENGGKVGVYPISEHSWMDMGELDQMENMRRRLEENG